MKSLYINLDSRPDRRAEAEAEFARVGLSPERFPAFTNDNPCLAFNKSVYGCMEKAKGIIECQHGNSVEGYTHSTFENDNLLLLEDDVVFDVTNPMHNLEIVRAYAAGFMTIHLGCNIIGTDQTVWKMPERIEPFYSKLYNCWQSHATLYSAECVQYILDNFPYHKDEYQKEGLIIFDEWLRTNVLTMGRSYVLNPMIAFQRPSVSDIWGGRFTDYTGAHKQGNAWMKNNL